MPYPGYKIINTAEDLEGFEPDFLSDSNPMLIMGGRVYGWTRVVIAQSGVYYVPSTFLRVDGRYWSVHDNSRPTGKNRNVRPKHFDVAGELAALRSVWTIFTKSRMGRQTAPMTSLNIGFSGVAIKVLPRHTQPPCLLLRLHDPEMGGVFYV